MRLLNKVAIITAGASGIGKAGALLFAKEGATVHILDIDPNNGDRVVEEIHAQAGKAFFYKTDLTDLNSIKASLAQIVNKEKQVDVLWNNAGIGGQTGIQEVEEHHYEFAMNLNVKSGFFMTKYVVPYMPSPGGSIIFTSSIRGLVASPFNPLYSTGKGAVTNLVRSLAVMLGPQQIRVNALCPGLTETPMLTGFWTSQDERELEDIVRPLIKDIPMGRLGQPEEIAKAALFLASDDSQYVTGVNMPVDGGFTAQ